jgi:hypothetical protein
MSDPGFVADVMAHGPEEARKLLRRLGLDREDSTVTTEIRELPAPTATHGPAVAVRLGRRHEGQIVTPVVRAWRKGKGYLVQVSAYDASDRTYAQSAEFSGDYHACIRWIATQGVVADID